jgi:hypothetical protein
MMSISPRKWEASSSSSTCDISIDLYLVCIDTGCNLPKTDVALPGCILCIQDTVSARDTGCNPFSCYNYYFCLVDDDDDDFLVPKLE